MLELEGLGFMGGGGETGIDARAVGTLVFSICYVCVVCVNRCCAFLPSFLTDQGGETSDLLLPLEFTRTVRW